MSRFGEIEAFVAIAQAGSITKAAQRLGIAKSAASRRLSDLEIRLGAQLFNRTTRQLSLTDVGAEFFKRASTLMDDLVEAEAAASEGQKSLVGTLRVAAPLSFGLRHLRSVVSEFARKHPRVDLDIDFSDRRVDLVAEGFDIAVRIGVLTDSSLIARRLCPIKSAVVAAPKFWRRYGKPKHPSDLGVLPFLRYSNLSRPGVVPFWGPKGEEGVVEPKIRMLANNGEFLMQMAIDGHGFLVEPTFFLHEAMVNGSLVRQLPDFAWSNANLHVVYPPTRQPSARVRAFADAVIGAFNNNPFWDAEIAAASNS
jgi:DNA-binding transcriptional LysR family regulator